MDMSHAATPPAIIDLAKLLARLAASEIVVSGDLAEVVVDARPISSEIGLGPNGMVARS